MIDFPFAKRRALQRSMCVFSVWTKASKFTRSEMKDILLFTSHYSPPATLCSDSLYTTIVTEAVFSLRF